MIGPPLGLVNFNGTLQLNARRGDVAEDHVRLSETPSRLGYVHIFRTVVTLEDRERPLKQLKRFGRITKVAMRVSKTPQRECHMHMFGTNILLQDRKRALEQLARLAGIAELDVDVQTVKQPHAVLEELLSALDELPRKL